MTDSKKNSSSTSSNKKRVLIQIERPEENLKMINMNELLKDTGIELDKDYGPFVVNPTQGKFVIRGYADPESEEKALKIKGVLLFHDPPIEDDATKLD